MPQIFFGKSCRLRIWISNQQVVDLIKKIFFDECIFLLHLNLHYVFDLIRFDSTFIKSKSSRHTDKKIVTIPIRKLKIHRQFVIFQLTSKPKNQRNIKIDNE